MTPAGGQGVERYDERALLGCNVKDLTKAEKEVRRRIKNKYSKRNSRSRQQQQQLQQHEQTRHTSPQPSNPAHLLDTSHPMVETMPRNPNNSASHVSPPGDSDFSVSPCVSSPHPAFTPTPPAFSNLGTPCLFFFPPQRIYNPLDPRDTKEVLRLSAAYYRSSNNNNHSSDNNNSHINDLLPDSLSTTSYRIEPTMNDSTTQPASQFVQLPGPSSLRKAA